MTFFIFSNINFHFLSVLTHLALFIFFNHFVVFDLLKFYSKKASIVIIFTLNTDEIVVYQYLNLLFFIALYKLKAHHINLVGKFI